MGEKLRRAVSEHAADLCDLTGAPPEDFETYEEACKIEFTDLGLVSPSVKPVQRPQQEEQKVEAKPEKGFDFMILAYCAAAVALLFKISVCLYMVKSRRAKGISEPSADAAFSMEGARPLTQRRGRPSTRRSLQRMRSTIAQQCHHPQMRPASRRSTVMLKTLRMPQLLRWLL